MSISAEIREQLLNTFRAELVEHIQTMTDGLLALEQRQVAGDQRQELLQAVFRAAHSLKGAARAVGATAIEQLSHELESVLDAMRREAIDLTPDLYTTCYRALDTLHIIQAAYEAGELTPPIEALQAITDLSKLRASKKAPTQQPTQGQTVQEEPVLSSPGRNQENQAQILTAEPGPPANQETDLSPALAAMDQSAPEKSHLGDETIRVNVSKLDSLMAQLSELMVTKIRNEQRLAQVRQFQQMIVFWQKDWFSARNAYGRLVRQGGIAGDSSRDLQRLIEYAGASQERLREIHSRVNDLAREYANDSMHMSLVIDEMEEEVKRVLMLPLHTISSSFGRMVRDLAREAGKEAVLHITGGDTELDKHVLEQIKDPLIHMLRNAVDHGIESPGRRKALGKPACGSIRLKAEQLGKEVVISVSDDGSGIDIPAIRQALIRQRGPEARALSDADVVEATFQIGVSSKTIVTGISGRGVGLDVVRRKVEALQGRIDVDWQPELGSTYRLTLPLRLTTSRGLLVRVSGQLFAVPINTIERILLINAEDISTLEGHDTLLYHGRPVTLVHLEDVLELQNSKTARTRMRIPVVILAAAERRMAFAVDELAGEQELVIKDLGKQLLRVGGISGVTVMGSGEIILILNVADLIKLALRGECRSVTSLVAESESPKEINKRKHILVVDDSITTRTLEKNILEAAGYFVQVATDGSEVFTAIHSNGNPDLIISDVAMPRMNGFDLTRRIKGDPQTAHIPVILVTSLESPEDKAMGIEVGADAYIVKGSFDQNNLLETIQQLI